MKKKSNLSICTRTEVIFCELLLFPLVLLVHDPFSLGEVASGHRHLLFFPALFFFSSSLIGKTIRRSPPPPVSDAKIVWRERKPRKSNSPNSKGHCFAFQGKWQSVVKFGGKKGGGVEGLALSAAGSKRRKTEDVKKALNVISGGRG